MYVLPVKRLKRKKKQAQAIPVDGSLSRVTRVI